MAGNQLDQPWLAHAVRARRRELGLRQDEAADLAGVSERFVFALENGKTSLQLDKVTALLSALGLHLELHRGHGPAIQAAPDLPE
jgi:y4mF family transcriptional regulator